jgi:diguanylate cyclase (GGDEF)-like protein/PAS domain S-box-containing protein
MMTEYICPTCSYPLLCHVRFGKPYWYCIHCHEEMPYGINNQITVHKEAEEKLRRYKLISEHTRDIILFLQRDGQITEANNAALKTYGYERDELLSLKIHDLNPSENLEIVTERLAKSQRVSITFETTHRRKNGSTFPVEISAQSMDLGQEKIILTIIKDITQSKIFEGLLRQQVYRDKIVSALQERIHQSLNLKDILQATVKELREYLQADRVIIYQVLPQGNGNILVESVTRPHPSMLGFLIHDPLIIERKALALYHQGAVRAIADINQEGLDQRMLNLLKYFQVKSSLAVPILQKSSYLMNLQEELSVPSSGGANHENHLWGVLIAHNCVETREWYQPEIDLMKGLSVQIAIAIQQSELYREFQKAHKQLQQLINIDPLTLMANRSKFDEYINSESERLSNTKEYLSVLLCNIDCLNNYNENYGYPAGDRVLKQIGQILRSVANRQTDLVARYQGGEFAVILPYRTPEITQQIAEEIRFRVKALEIDHNQSPISQYITVSLGIASLIPQTQIDASQLLIDATKNLNIGREKRRLRHNRNLENAQSNTENPQETQIETTTTDTNSDLLMSYVAYYVSRGKSVISPLNGPLYFQGLVYEYGGYHKDFQEFWKELQQRRDFSELYLEGDIDYFGKFLHGKCTVVQCARCNLPIPVAEGSVYAPPNCTFCDTPFIANIKSKYSREKNSEYQSDKTIVLAIGTPPSNIRKQRKLFLTNGFDVKFISQPSEIIPEELPKIVDMVLIHAEVSENQGKVWAEELQAYPQLKNVPIIALSSQAKSSLPWEKEPLGLEDYILAPLGGDRLISHLHQMDQLKENSSSAFPHWFPR